MQPLQLSRIGRTWRRMASALALTVTALVAGSVLAQPTNDNFASPTVLSGLWASDATDNTGATAEPGEPSHAGFVPVHSIWYKWTAPGDGEVSVDTINSAVGAIPLDTVLAVYAGTNLTTLRQVAANDDMFPFLQENIDGQNFPAQAMIGSNVVNYTIPVLFVYFPAFTGPSSLKFNATANTTYYLAVDTKFATGPISLSLAYQPAGAFRFATEEQDFMTTTPMYHVSEWESLPDNVSTYQTYYTYDPLGALVTVTRVGGSSGRMLVDFATQDGTAIGGLNYLPINTTLVFDDFEMSKSVVIPIFFGFSPLTNDADFTVTLSNPRPDPLETPNVSPPRVDQVFSTAIVRILPIMTLGSDPDQLPGTNGPPTHDVFAFGKSHYYVPEDVNDYYTRVEINVFRTLAQNAQGDGAQLNYRVNNFLADDFDADEEYNNLFPLQPGSDYATPIPPDITNLIRGTNGDFNLTQGTLSFGNREAFRPIFLTITNDVFTEFNEDFHIQLYRINNNAVVTVGEVNECSVTILYDDRDPPAGSVDEFHNTDFGISMVPPVSTIPPQNAHPGADGVVYSLAVQPDNKTVIGGNFFSYNTTPRNNIARMNQDGTLDVTFTPGDGANDFIGAVALTPGGQVCIAGGFTSFDGTYRSRVARLTSTGQLDATFDPGLGANSNAWAMALQPDGKLLIAGEFTTFNGTNRMHIARLNANGSLDTTFDPGLNGPNGNIWAIALQADGKIVIGGEFANVGGLMRRSVARLNADGSVDTSFDPGAGTDGIVYALALRADAKIWMGGEFASVNGTTFHRFARLNANGSVDITFDPGAGANDTVYTISVHTNGQVYVGGLFTSFNGTHRMGFTRLFEEGTVDTSFLDSAYNQFAGLHKARVSDPSGIVFTSAVQPDQNVMIGGSFTQVGGGQADANIRFDPNYPTNTYNSYVWTEHKARDGLRNRSNVARLIGGSTPGPGNIGFLYDNYSMSEAGSFIAVALTRTNGTLGYAAANFAVQPGLIQSGVDYFYNSREPDYISSWRADFFFPASAPNSITRMHSDGLFGTNSIPVDIFGDYWFNYTPGNVYVSVVNDNLVNGNRGSVFELADPVGANQFYLGGANIPLGTALGRSRAPFTIVDDDHNYGVLGFASASYAVNENGTNATITLTRTNGSYNRVSVTAQTTTGGTAIPGTDYVTTSKTVTFNDRQTNASFTIPIINNSIVQPVDRTVNLRLVSPSGGATLGLATAVLSIVDDDYPPGYVNFTAAAYVTNEDAGAVTVTVARTGGSSGTLTVQCATTNGTALDGIHYLGITNTLQWNDGDSAPRYFTVPLIHDGLVGPDVSFNVVLSNAKVNLTNALIVLGGALTRSTITILESDFYGALQFGAPSYIVSENGGTATFTVTRTSGSAQSVSVSYLTADGTAVSTGLAPNFVATSGTLNFAPGEIAKSFDVQLIDDGFVDPSPFFFSVILTNPVPGGILGAQNVAVVNIVDAESFNEPAGSPDTAFNPDPGFNGNIFCLGLQPDGGILAGGEFTFVNNVVRNRLARINPDASLDRTFLENLTGINGPVRTLLLQSDGRILLGGAFSSVNGVNRSRIGRVQQDGTLDPSFNPGAGADNDVFALAEISPGPYRQLLVGGSFTAFAGQPHQALVRLNNDGSVDGYFNPTLSINGTVYAIAVYPTNTPQGGKILVGGDFTSINGATRQRIARLNADGTLDTSFDSSNGADDVIRAIAIQLDGNVLIGGAFGSYAGATASRIARLQSNGGLDPNFNGGAGANDTVESIVMQPDNRILLAGQFTSASGVTRQRVTRLLVDGSVDPAINFGAGANGFINAVTLQPDGKILIGGGFTTFDGEPRAHLARLYGGAIAGSGAFEFAVANFQVDENGTNGVITIRRRGGTAGNMTVDFSTAPNTAVPDVNYTNVAATLAFPEGETFQTINVPVRDDLQVTPDLLVDLALANPSPPAGLGNQPIATLTILNDNSTISFSSAAYRVLENIAGGVATINLVRQGSTRQPASVDFLTTTNGTALAFTNYIPVTNSTFTFLGGQSNLSVTVHVLRSFLVQGDVTVGLELTNANNALLLSPFSATLTIVDVDSAPGQFAFAATNFVVSEAAGFLPVTILRTNGRTGIVSVDFTTQPGTALPGIKYGSTNGTLTFADNETNKTFTVPIFEENQVEGNLTLSLALSNPQGGTSLLGPTNVPVTILDDDVGIGFSSPAYVVSETAGSVALTVLRQNGTNGVSTVGYATTNVTAVAGTNYVAVTNGLLTFTNGETIKSFSVPILRDPRVTGDLSFVAYLFNPSVPAQLLNPAAATVVILDVDPGITFASTNFFAVTNADQTVVSNAAFGVLKSGTNVTVTVVRSNANTGLVSVNYATSNRTAVAGIDYTPASGTLYFSNGISLQSFVVPIINNGLAQGDRTFDINLFTNTLTGAAQLLTPRRATVVITDDVSGLSFSSPVYGVNENGALATITVLRTSYTNSTVSVDFATLDGTARASANYVSTNGTLVFTNGEIAKSFNVQIIDDSVVDGDKTVLLSLSHVLGRGVLGSPSAATLTIFESDGSLIAPAGSALYSESGPVNGVIDTNETVTLLLALRNSSGTNTVNLVATLLATNGVTNPSGPQNYGALVTHGASKFQSFTFTAVGTNGQPLGVTLALRDGSTVLSNVVFNFVLGNIPRVWSNSAPITIRDRTNAVPYPSVVTVSGFNGVLTRATVTVTNLNHSSPQDVSMVLVSPTGQKSYLMSKCGSTYSVTNLTLTFDSVLTNALPISARITSGSYQPTSYHAQWPAFPTPLTPPFSTNLAVFNGSNPNGDWGLYILDDVALDSGVISNGWSLQLNTAAPVAADVGVTMDVSPSVTVATSNVTYSITVSNYGPASASNIVVSDVLPPGVTYVGFSGPAGTGGTNASGVFAWTVPWLATNASASLSLILQPAVAGLLTNTVTVASSTTDLNPDDDSASVIATVVTPTADLVLGLASSPDPVILSGNVTYSIVVSNLGPATAPALTITNILPSGVAFVSASPASYVVSGRNVGFTNLGSLPAGNLLSVFVVGHPTMAGLFTNTATTASGFIDPLKANNTASVKTVVQGVQLTVVRSGGNLVFSWLDVANLNLETTTNLAPAVWIPVTNPPPTISGGVRSVSLPIGTGRSFYRTHGTSP